MITTVLALATLLVSATPASESVQRTLRAHDPRFLRCFELQNVE